MENNKNYNWKHQAVVGEMPKKNLGSIPSSVSWRSGGAACPKESDRESNEVNQIINGD